MRSPMKSTTRAIGRNSGTDIGDRGYIGWIVWLGLWGVISGCSFFADETSQVIDPSLQMEIVSDEQLNIITVKPESWDLIEWVREHYHSFSFMPLSELNEGQGVEISVSNHFSVAMDVDDLDRNVLAEKAEESEDSAEFMQAMLEYHTQTETVSFTLFEEHPSEDSDQSLPIIFRTLGETVELRSYLLHDEQPFMITLIGHGELADVNVLIEKGYYQYFIETIKHTGSLTE